MRILPLYPELPLPAVQLASPLDRNPDCTRCPLHTGTPAGQRCLSAEGTPGDILVVLDHPTEFERRLGRPAASPSGVWIRSLIAKIAPGRSVVFTYALGCKPLPNQETKDLIEPLAQCRPYLAGVLKDASPQIVLLFNSLAGIGFLGRSFQPLSVRTGYGMFVGELVSPAYLLGDPAYAMRNKLIARAMEEDLRHALLGALPSFPALSLGYGIIETVEDAVEAWEVLQRAAYVATDCETSGMLHEPDFRIECLATSDGEMTYVWPRESVESEEIGAILASVLEDNDQVTWNGQYDLVAIECEPLLKRHQLGGRKWLLNLQSDSRIKRKLYEADAVADLGTAAELVGMGGHKTEAHDQIGVICSELRKLAMARNLTPTGKVRKAAELKVVDPKQVPPEWLVYLDQGFEPEKFAYRFLDRDVMHRYCALDALSTSYLEDWCLQKLVEHPNLALIWDEVAQPAMWAWCCARLTGFPTDKRRVELLRDYLNVEIDKLYTKIQAYEPGMNPNSPAQIAVAFAKRGLVSKRLTPSGAVKMDKEVMVDFKGKHPLVDLVLTYKMFKHTQDNFAEGLLMHVRTDGRCHPSFLQDGTSTGRPSSSDPNFFNRLKGRDEESRKLGTMLRECHTMPPGFTLIEADEGQIEIRAVMDLCEDPVGIATIVSGVDFHMASARSFATVLGKDPEKVTDLDRETAKTCNFAAIYELPDQLGFMLAQRLGIPNKAGNELATALFGSYLRLKPWMDECLSDATRTGYASTLWRGQEGRHRPLWHLGLPVPNRADRTPSKDKSNWQTHARSTWNGRAQGGAVDIVTSMLWPVQCWLDANTSGGQFLLQIYDSIMVMVPDDDVGKTIAFLRELMTDTVPGKKMGYLKAVPLTIDVKTGKSWGGMSKVKA